MQTTSVKVALNPQSTAFVQRAIAAGKTADDIINEALTLLQRISSLEARREDWLREELKKGEDSGEPLLYTAELLNSLEQDALIEAKMVAASRAAYAEHVADGRKGYTQSEMESWVATLQEPSPYLN